jgi:hypothetical protein
MLKAPKPEENFGVNCVQGEADPRVVIVHETQGTTVEGAVNTLKTRSDGSAHEVCGPDSRGRLRVVKLVKSLRTILCHTGGQNTGSVGVEKVGISAWKRAFRLASRTERRNISLTAFRTARNLHKIGSPPRYLGVRTLNRGSHVSDFRGWCYHADCTKAFGTTTHSDPGIKGISWPHKRFKTLVRFYYQFPGERDLDIGPRKARRRLRSAHE